MVGIRFYGDKAELGTNPLALAHGEGITSLGEAFAISGIGKAHGCSMLRTAIGIAAAEIADRKAQVDILVDAWLVVDLVLGSGFQRGNQLLQVSCRSWKVLPTRFTTSAA